MNLLESARTEKCEKPTPTYKKTHTENIEVRKKDITASYLSAAAGPATGWSPDKKSS